MDLEEIKELVNTADFSTSATREEASDMLVFGRITQWGDEVSNDVQVEFRGTFDYIKPKRNRILKDLWSNPIDVTFKAKDGASDDAAETLTGMFRSDMQRSEEARETCQQDQVDCGMGAFRFITEYESNFDDMNNYQRISMEPISEANNVVYWDANAKKKDKSDARWVAIIHTYTHEGWERYLDEMGINSDGLEYPMPFKEPHNSESWFWRGGEDEVKIGEFYHKEVKRERVLMFEDPLGQVKAVYQKEVKDVIDDMEASGFVKIGQKMKERWVVKKALVTGDKIVPIDGKEWTTIPGEHLPVISAYGDWSRVEGREIWRGIYHDAQDQQRLINFSLSYFGDTVAQGAREKPLLPAGQVAGLEYMWTQTGADDNYPYRLYNETSPETGQPYGPIQYLKPPEVPTNVIGLLQAMRQSLDDVTGGQMGQPDMMNAGVTEGQIQQSMKSLENEAYIYQNSYALAIKQAARVYASMASDLYDVPREVTDTKQDGTESTVMLMESVFDEETGEEVVINDITKGKFEVYADVGPSFQSQKDEARARLEVLYKETAGTESGELALLTYMSIIEGPGLDHLRKHARKKLILQYEMEPETEEEEQMVQEAQQQQENQQPDANMVLAMAEQAKADADMAKVQGDAQESQQTTQIKLYEAMTKRVKVEADAQKSGYDVKKTLAETEGVELENIRKQMETLSDQDLFNVAAGGQ